MQTHNIHHKSNRKIDGSFAHYRDFFLPCCACKMGGYDENLQFVRYKYVTSSFNDTMNV